MPFTADQVRIAVVPHGTDPTAGDWREPLTVDVAYTGEIPTGTVARSIHHLSTETIRVYIENTDPADPQTAMATVQVGPAASMTLRKGVRYAVMWRVGNAVGESQNDLVVT